MISGFGGEESEYGLETLLRDVPLGLYVGGSWRSCQAAASFAVLNPATGEVLAEIEDSGEAECRSAMDAASSAQVAWSCTAPGKRGDLLEALHEVLVRDSERLAALITLEMGKPIAESLGEVSYAADFVRWYAEEARRIYGRVGVTPGGEIEFLVRRKAVGPCYLITPWNFPLAMATRKLAPALAAGCTAILKPSELTPLTTQWLGRLVDEVGFPAGVVNILPTTEPQAMSESLMYDGRLRKISFTGSTAVGRQLLRMASSGVLRASMELGGNAPFIVFDDADLDEALEGALVAKMRNGGAACTAANRFLVQEGVIEEFSSRLSERIGAERVGSGFEPGVSVGPLIEDRARRNVSRLVDEAVTSGARVLTGGGALPGAGFFFEPTVLSDVPRNSSMLGEEIFGPVAPIVKFSDDDDAVELANDTEAGLVAYIYSESAARVRGLAQRIETGMIGWNVGKVSNAAVPFGGVKASGLGREGGPEGLSDYLEYQYVASPADL